MHPFRESAVHAKPRSRAQPEELILYALLIAIGAIPVAIALGEQAAFGVEATLGLIMMCLGALGGLGDLARSRRRE